MLAKFAAIPISPQYLQRFFRPRFRAGDPAGSLARPGRHILPSIISASAAPRI
jgi:hypothetical protein